MAIPHGITHNAWIRKPSVTGLLSLHPSHIVPDQIHQMRILPIGRYTEKIFRGSGLFREEDAAIEDLGLEQEVRSC